MKHLRLLLIVLGITVIVTGCKINLGDGTNDSSAVEITEDNVSEIMLAKLEAKYKTKLVVNKVEEMHSAYLFNYDPCYYASVSLKQNSTKKFDVHLYADGGRLYDNYSKLVFDAELSSDIVELMNTHDFIQSYDYRWYYVMSNMVWDDISQKEELIQTDNAFISLDLLSKEVSYTTSLEDDFIDLISDLESNNYCYDIKLTVGDRIVYFSTLDDTNPLSESEIRATFKERLN